MRLPRRGRHQRSSSMRGDVGVICCFSGSAGSSGRGVGVKRGLKSSVLNSGGVG